VTHERVERAPGEPRIRIAAVGGRFDDSGSLAIQFRRNFERLARDEDVIAVCAAEGRLPTDARIRFETVSRSLPQRGRVIRALARAEFAVRATRVVRRIRAEVDVVHVDGVSALDADLVTFHAVRPADAERYWQEIHPAGLGRRLVGAWARPAGSIERWIEHRLLRFRPLCIAVTPRVAADLERTYGVPPDRIEVVPYPVDLDTFAFDEAARGIRRAALGVPDERLVVLFVGDDLLRKGLHRAIAALARAQRSDIELWVAGGGDARRFREFAGGLGVADRVRWLGRLPSHELPSWYSAADVLLLPSERDVWGIPVIEALAAGRMVVVSAFTGASEVIRDGESGFVLDRIGEPEQIAALLDGPLRDPALQASFGEAGRLAAAPFDTESVYRRFRDAHHHALGLRLARRERRGDNTIDPQAPARSRR
jgi:glycosyltransferase involved in cell wall biosynthesis